MRTPGELHVLMEEVEAMEINDVFIFAPQFVKAKSGQTALTDQVRKTSAKVFRTILDDGKLFVVRVA